MRRFVSAALVALCMAVVVPILVYGDLVISGPGISPAPPLRLNSNPPDGPQTVLYTLENDGAAGITMMPNLQCPADTVKAFPLILSSEIPAHSSRLLEIRFADRPGGPAAGDTVECFLTTNSTGVAIFIRLVTPAAQPPLGSLSLSASMSPQTSSQEASFIESDIEANLKLNLTLGGVTLGGDLGWGFTGPEFAIFNLSTFLGIFDIFDQFVFAAPFDVNGVSLAGGALSFVKKRVRLRFDLLGLKVDNLAILENSKFTNPFANNAQALDAVQTPAYRFGDILQLNGQTASGLPLRMLIGICADPAQANLIKKRFFSGRVCDSKALNFTVSRLTVGPLSLGAVQISSSMEFRPGAPLRGVLSLGTTLLGLVNAFTTASFDPQGIALQFTLLSLAQPAQALSISLTDKLSLSGILLRFSVNVAPSRLSFLLRGSPNGLDEVSATLLLPLGSGRLFATLSLTGAGTVSLSQLSINWNQELGRLRTNANVAFSLHGLQQAQVNFTLIL